MPRPTNEEVAAAIERVTNRFWQLSSEAEAGADGLTQIAVGLNELLEELGEDPDFPMFAFHTVVMALDALGERLESPPEAMTTDDSTPTIDVGAAVSVRKFVEAFRLEAKKRLAGLSLSLTAVFNTSDERAIDQTVGHLHAIRGGAGMLGLEAIAALSGAMEDVILATKRAGSDLWPVRPLLRGFATLEAAIEDPDSGYDNIVRSLTDELRGHLVDLDENRRSTFDDQPITDVRKQPIQQRILVVDDVETIAHSVGLILSELDIPIDVAHSGDEALSRLRDTPYSLVISDVAMPGMSGLELTQQIREDEALSDLPVILLTALDKEDEREAGLEAGASDYIVKGSIGGGELVSRVSELLRTAPVVPAPPDDEEGGFRQILIAEDIETIAASIAFVLSEGPYEITLAHDGREALELLRGRSFDLVISDLQMPAMDGFELLSNLGKEGILGGTPVVLLTSRDSEEERAKATELGASRYLIKGAVGGGKLLEIVEDLLSQR